MCEDQVVHAPLDTHTMLKRMAVVPVLLGLLVFHFVAVGLYVCPPNPVSLTARSWVAPYIVPYFTQHWELFAPEPAGTNDSVHIRCHRDDGEKPTITDWIDITAPLLRAHQRNRFGAASRLLRASRPLLFKPQEFERRAVEHLSGAIADQATEMLDAEAEAYLQRGRAHLQRLASAECKRRYGAGIEQVEARLVAAKVPPYGSRHAMTEPSPTAVALAPMPYVEVAL